MYYANDPHLFDTLSFLLGVSCSMIVCAILSGRG